MATLRIHYPHVVVLSDSDVTVHRPKRQKAQPDLNNINKLPDPPGQSVEERLAQFSDRLIEMIPELN